MKYGKLRAPAALALAALCLFVLSLSAAAAEDDPRLRLFVPVLEDYAGEDVRCLLYDVNGDGLEELAVCLAEPEPQNYLVYYYVDIYAVEGDSAELWNSYGFCGGAAGWESGGLALRNGVCYFLISSYDDGMEGYTSTVMYDLSPRGDDHELLTGEPVVDLETWERTAIYEIDGEACSRAEYERFLAQFELFHAFDGFGPDLSVSLGELRQRLLRAEAPAAASFSVNVDGTPVRWSDAVPFIDGNGRTMAPLRAVGNALGLAVDWNGRTREAVFSDGKRTLYFPVGSTIARGSDGTEVAMDTAAVIVEDRTYTPVRYLAEYFGYTVEWNGSARTVTLYSPTLPYCGVVASGYRNINVTDGVLEWVEEWSTFYLRREEGFQRVSRWEYVSILADGQAAEIVNLYSGDEFTSPDYPDAEEIDLLLPAGYSGTERVTFTIRLYLNDGTEQTVIRTVLL